MLEYELRVVKMDSNINLKELDSLFTGFWLADLANFCAFFSPIMRNINWLGFYLSDKKALRLGPFIGKPACVKIAFDKGVCGKAFSTKTAIIVDDVDQFPDHIRCDSASKSEMVLPFIINGEVVGVLDVDSPSVGRFKKDDQQLLESALQILGEKIAKYSGARFGKLT
jgi:L-methionine (R)-S-oxide reductase